VTFIGLMLRNLATRRFRSVLTAAAVSIGVLSVVGLGVLTFSLHESAVSILRTGKADFSVAQKHVDDLLNSTIDEGDLRSIQRMDGVESAVGALVDTTKLDAGHPLVIEIGLRSADQAPFGVALLSGRSYRDGAADEVMVGYRLAKDLGLSPGSRLLVGDRRLRVVGTFRTGVAIGDSGLMYPLRQLQAEDRLVGNVTLLFVRVQRGADVARVRQAIDHDLPQLTTLQDSTDYGQADRNLVLIGAANVGGSILAIVIGATGVMNTSLLSFFERVREFGLLRSVGWSRWRVLLLVLGEALIVSLVGAVVGVGLAVVVVQLLAHMGSLRGVLDPQYSAGVFFRGLAFAFGMAVVGALYPALRAGIAKMPVDFELMSRRLLDTFGLFCATGDKIEINTLTGEYRSRTKG